MKFRITWSIHEDKWLPVLKKWIRADNLFHSPAANTRSRGKRFPKCLILSYLQAPWHIGCSPSVRDALNRHGGGT